MSDPDLSSLRDSIAEVDRALLELLRRRMELAAEVGRIKAASGSPVEVRDVEHIVLDRARQHAEACGVSEEVMVAMFQAIIRGSVERQYRVGVSLRERRGESMLIVGGSGGMAPGSAASWSSRGTRWTSPIRPWRDCRRRVPRGGSAAWERSTTYTATARS